MRAGKIHPGMRLVKFIIQPHRPAQSNPYQEDLHPKGIDLTWAAKRNYPHAEPPATRMGICDAVAAAGRMEGEKMGINRRKFIVRGAEAGAGATLGFTILGR